MKVKSVKRTKLKSPEPVYDVYKASPHNNFLVDCNGEYLVSHNCGSLDEINFSAGSSKKLQESKILETYLTVKRRMESRYQKLGELPGMLFLISSKKSEQDFLEQYVKTVKDNPNVYFVDEPLWKVKPKSNYSGDIFPVAVGNKHIPSKLISEGEDRDSYIEQGFDILEVPVEHRQAFEFNVDRALQDIAGISSAPATRFFTYSQLRECYTERVNPFKTNILTIGLYDELKIEDFFLIDKIPDNIRSAYSFIHIDTSWKADITGITMVSIAGKREVSRHVQGSLVEEIDAIFNHVFTVGIKSPSDSEISFSKTREFIYYLRNQGFNIAGVSTDGYQSVDTHQALKQAGFQTEMISVDRSADPYIGLRSAVAENRIDLLKIDKLEEELLDLERDNVTGKIDHPEGSSKDLADSLCGAFYGGTRFKMLPHLKYASSDATSAIDLYTEDTTREDEENKQLLGIDGEVKVKKSLEDIILSSDDDVIDW